MSLYDLVKNSDNRPNALMTELSRLSSSKRFPLGAVFELSPVCNFKCPFCYARVSPEQLEERGERLLRFEDWKRFIDEAAELGTFKLSFTGGECTMHPDFARIYSYAYSKGFELTLMTNGSLIDDKLLEMFRSCPPASIYLTVYGASPETYQKLCGQAAYYDKVMENVRSLVRDRQELVLQFTAGKDNVGDLRAVYGFAKSLGIKLRYSFADIVFRRSTPEMLNDCGVTWREFKDASDELSMDEQGMTKEQLEELDKQPVEFKELPIIEKGMACGAGTRLFCINYKGIMQPCVNLDAISVDTKGRSLADCWREIVAACNEIPRITECTNCLHNSHCKRCVAIHYNDMGEFGKPSPRLCFKKQFPERAAEIEARFAEEGHLRMEDLR